MYPATNVDPVATPRSELQAMLNANAYRIADLLSQLEKSGAELRRLRARASRVRRGTRKPTARSPRATATCTTATSSPTSVMVTSAPTSPTPARGHWTPEEEQRFCNAMAEHGDTAYSAIAAAVGTRTEKQVRDHAWRVRQKGRAAAATEFAALQIPLPMAPAPSAPNVSAPRLVPTVSTRTPVSTTAIPTATTISTPAPTEPTPMILPQAAMSTPTPTPTSTPPSQAPMSIPIPGPVTAPVSMSMSMPMPMPMPAAIPTLRISSCAVPDSPPLSAVSDDLGLLQSEELGLDGLWDVPCALDLSCSPVETDSSDFADRFLIT